MKKVILFHSKKCLDPKVLPLFQVFLWTVLIKYKNNPRRICEQRLQCIALLLIRNPPSSSCLKEGLRFL